MADIFNEALQLYIKTTTDVLNEEGITKQFCDDHDVLPMDVVLFSLTGDDPKLKNENIGDIYTKILERCSRDFRDISIDEAYEYLDTYVLDEEYLYNLQNYKEYSQSDIDKIEQKQQDEGDKLGAWYYVNDNVSTISIVQDLIWYSEDSIIWQVDNNLSEKVYRLIKD